MSQTSPDQDRERAFRSLFVAVYPDLLRFAQRRVHPVRAEDVVADTMLVVWRRLEDLPGPPDDARAWVFGIARNVLLNDSRGERRRRALEVRLAEACPGPVLDGAEGIVDLVDLSRAWKLLPASHQEAIALAALEGLDAPLAAAVLGISPIAFRLRLSRARRALRAHLTPRLRQDVAGGIDHERATTS
ncbi:RNA polymerase, sigma-24 subunit, ECF subfamily [Xylanimonas cellulosilytica DSM 15894]|uniref:RNA polymerase, sigma-24 subunit, ECF subfamily n=1 Tax=Xylanimonas cellulosilytica (strain DSM 15894 / JCM 12276 / CECT 5975 / KCTC 9989 / LMG 20990 / NBRC 107835 / XIL07) TaxID=446471 RepID=D1BXW6_XYLCX|nr:sigma-70 family RNA polymerase sigma factor [Xylanimonas cellulosilytica]ACZ31757.1 RNA polymerase, sigma-24 subunit, ECF subfamily [Xylanimonas cellulosilytica DSM 15894]